MRWGLLHGSKGKRETGSSGCSMVEKQPQEAALCRLILPRKSLANVGCGIVSLSISQTPFDVSFRPTKTVKEPVYKVKGGSKAHLLLSPCHVLLASVL